MKKRFLNFGLYVALGLASTVFYACDKDKDNDSDENGGSGRTHQRLLRPM